MSNRKMTEKEVELRHDAVDSKNECRAIMQAAHHRMRYALHSDKMEDFLRMKQEIILAKAAFHDWEAAMKEVLAGHGIS